MKQTQLLAIEAVGSFHCALGFIQGLLVAPGALSYHGRRWPWSTSTRSTSSRLPSRRMQTRSYPNTGIQDRRFVSIWEGKVRIASSWSRRACAESPGEPYVRP